MSPPPPPPVSSSTTSTPYPSPSPHILLTHPDPSIAHVLISRPDKRNAFTPSMWRALRSVFEHLSRCPLTKVVVLSGEGEGGFSAGLDVGEVVGLDFMRGGGGMDPAERATAIRRYVDDFQDCIGSIEACEKPVIHLLHGISYGLAIDIACCADIRLCTPDARMSVKEVDIGLAADIGTLSRLPKIVGSTSWVKEVCMTAREFDGAEALRVGFVSEVVGVGQDEKVSKASLLEAALARAMEVAHVLADKSPVAVQGTKELLNHARDHSVADSSRYTSVWNSAMVQSGDVAKAMGKVVGRRKRMEKL